ncbi:TetR/AcrR family transcriptional regulator [Sinimarinibacterium flocculans]|uniref:TetR/AcrR family transcriptional regulator n=1 Tax=Sinimarinibacterium flocculans TaxID=985250 RepID=UPI00248FED12|nr:TetR/AcrR family transcriptional regulator [Sinimarinibacterium flocculans]
MTRWQREPAQPRKLAKQGRSRLLMQSIREAAVELIRRDGAEHITAIGIAERAGVSVGSFYQYYPNTEAVLTDIYEHILDRLNQRMAAELATTGGGFDRSLDQSIRDGVVLTFSLHRELLAVDPSFYATFLKRFNVTDARGPDGERSWNEWSVGWFAQLLDTHRQRLRHDDTAFVARFLVDVISGAVQRMAAERPEALDDPRVTQHVCDLIRRYLLE